MLADFAGLEQRLVTRGQTCDLSGAAPQSQPAVPPDQHADGDLNAAELDRRLAEHGLTPGAAVNIPLVWSGHDDVDLKLKCPGGEEVSFSHKEAASCQAMLDIDANYPADKAVDDPVENISVGTAVAGRYLVTVRRAKDQPPLGDAPFRLFVRQDGTAPRTFEATIVSGSAPRMTELKITVP